MTPTLLTASEAAERLRVSRSWITRHAAEIQAVKVGVGLMVPEDGIAAYLERQRVQAPEPETEPQETVRPALRALPARSPVGLVTGRRREARR